MCGWRPVVLLSLTLLTACAGERQTQPVAAPPSRPAAQASAAECRPDPLQPKLGLEEGGACMAEVIADGRKRRWGKKGALGALDTGWMAVRQGKLDLAMQAFNYAWLHFPDRGFAPQGLAVVVYQRDKDAKSADALFREAIAEPEIDPGAYADYGLFLLQSDRLAEAEMVLDQGLAKAPHFPPIRFNRGLLHGLRGEMGPACEHVKAAASAGHGEAQGLVASVCVGQG